MILRKVSPLSNTFANTLLFCKNLARKINEDSMSPAEEFNKLLPNASLYWVDKCGHAPMMEHPDKFNELLEDWLNKENL